MHKIMNTKLYLATAFMLVSSLLACKHEHEINPTIDPGQPTEIGTSTEVGQPDGNAISQTIGPEGGSLSTPMDQYSWYYRPEP